MTQIGISRLHYSAFVEIAPSRFSNAGLTYKAWASRADSWVGVTA
jgi:hypothetical protein